MKKMLLGIIICGVLFSYGCNKKVDNLMVENEQLKTTIKILEVDLSKAKSNYRYLETDYDELENKKKEIESAAARYIMLDETEKAIVDAKIDEVRLSTETEKLRLKEEEEAKKAELKRLEEEKKAQEEQAKKEAEAQKYNTGLTWENIAREERYGELGTFEGKVLQVMQGEKEVQYRVAINGDYDKVMYITIKNVKIHTTILEDDYIYFTGASRGTITYETVMGAKKTIPSFLVDEYKL